VTSPRAAADKRFCTFFLGDECYGIDILTVREINRQVKITPARGAPPAVRGFLNLRGDRDRDRSGRATRLRARELLPTSRLVILKTNADLARLGIASFATDDELAGLWIDRISDVISVGADQISPAPPDQSGKNDQLIAAIVQRNEQVIRLVDPSALLRHGASG
jgi:chemotaxis signal transduction protein